MVVFEMLTAAAEIKAATESAGVWLTLAAERFGNLLVEAEVIMPAGAEALKASAATMCGQMQTNRNFDFANFTVTDLGLFAAHGKSVHLLTYHGAKGLEFDAVVLTSLNDGSIPFFRRTTVEGVNEARRQFYVGITRAKRYLLYVSDQEKWQNKPSRFLGSGGLGFV